jgi:ABC-type spermidine/putrescine transport systems, ATPase components
VLDVQSLTKLYYSRNGTAGGVRDTSFTVERGAFFTLLGPSGCGKTTTLRCIAGLIQPDHGAISINGSVVFDDSKGIALPANRRSIGMVFQSYAIWPHLSVFENAAFPLRVDQHRRHSSTEIRKRVLEVLEIVGLAGFESRSATQLSGGQQQRLALARAMVHRPALLLLDEPLSNLDVKLREGMRAELQRLQREAGITAIYVTHDQGEALAMSDSIAVFERGELIQLGSPDDIYYAPRNRFVASFVGAANLIAGHVAGRSADRLDVRLSDGSVIGCAPPAWQADPGKPVTVCVRPESIRIVAPADEAVRNDRNRIAGRVTNRVFLGNMTTMQVEAAGAGLQVMRRSAKDGPQVEAGPGDSVTLSFPVAGAVALDG